MTDVNKFLNWDGNGFIGKAKRDSAYFMENDRLYVQTSKRIILIKDYNKLNLGPEVHEISPVGNINEILAEVK